MTRDQKHTVQLISSVIMLCFGCLLIAAGFLIEPTGKIDNSVIVAFGEILSFSGAIMGIDYRYKVKDTPDKEQ